MDPLAPPSRKPPQRVSEAPGPEEAISRHLIGPGAFKSPLSFLHFMLGGGAWRAWWVSLVRSNVDHLERCLAFLLPLQRLLSGPVTLPYGSSRPSCGAEQCRRSPFNGALTCAWPWEGRLCTGAKERKKERKKILVDK